MIPNKLKTVVAGLCLATLLTTIAVAPALANRGPCGPRKDILAHLSKRFTETRRAIGLASERVMMELFVSKKGSWTILMSTAKGTSCIVAAGRAWQQTLVPPGPEA